MDLNELRAKRKLVNDNVDITLSNMQTVVNESERVADIAHNSKKILDNLDEEFEKATQLKGNDVKFLFTALGLQLLRIYIVNEITQIEVAGSTNRNETKLHDFQEKILGYFKTSESLEKPYYASMEHIISKAGVPYDATTSLTEKTLNTLIKKDRTWNFDLSEFMPSDNEKLSLFKGANHRFATLGHDPVLGLVFGTGNIMTNTITCVRQPVIHEAKVGIPVLTTNHVIFTSDFKDPRIATYASTAIMLKCMGERIKNEPEAFVASLIKQIIHIGTDMFTPCGIQIPVANLILSNTAVEKLTKYVNWGDMVKGGTSALISNIINLIIETVYMLTYDTGMRCSREEYNIRSRKIIDYSNLIATGSNVIWTGVKVIGARNVGALRQLDIGGLITILNRLKKDKQYIREIKQEFVLRQFNKKIEENAFMLKQVNWE